MTVHFVFDHYNVPVALKQQMRDRRTTSTYRTKSHMCTDTTLIKKQFLASDQTKESLTEYLAKKALEKYSQLAVELTIATQSGAQSNKNNFAGIDCSSDCINLCLSRQGCRVPSAANRDRATLDNSKVPTAFCMSMSGRDLMTMAIRANSDRFSFSSTVLIPTTTVDVQDFSFSFDIILVPNFSNETIFSETFICSLSTHLLFDDILFDIFWDN